MRTVRLNKLQLKDGDRVLDLGCGEGRHLHAMYFAAKVYAVGVDLGFEEVCETRRGFEQHPDMEDPEPRFGLAVANAKALPFDDNSFDVIVCSEVLEHIHDYLHALSEIERILKPGGALAVSVPRYWPEWMCWRLSKHYHNTPGGHVRIFKPGQLREDISRFGLEWTNTHWAHGLHSPYWWLQCAFWNTKDQNWVIRTYHSFLVWDIMKRPWLTRMLEKIADPLMGKSIVFYFRKGNEGIS